MELKWQFDPIQWRFDPTVTFFGLPSIKSSRVWARFWINSRQFFTLDAVAALVVVVVVDGAVVVRTLFKWLLVESNSCRLFACDSTNARSSSKSAVLGHFGRRFWFFLRTQKVYREENHDESFHDGRSMFWILFQLFQI